MKIKFSLLTFALLISAISTISLAGCASTNTTLLQLQHRQLQQRPTSIKLRSLPVQFHSCRLCDS